MNPGPAAAAAASSPSSSSYERRDFCSDSLLMILNMTFTGVSRKTMDESLQARFGGPSFEKSLNPYKSRLLKFAFAAFVAKYKGSDEDLKQAFASDFKSVQWTEAERAQIIEYGRMWSEHHKNKNAPYYHLKYGGAAATAAAAEPGARKRLRVDTTRGAPKQLEDYDGDDENTDGYVEPLTPAATPRTTPTTFDATLELCRQVLRQPAPSMVLPPSPLLATMAPTLSPHQNFPQHPSGFKFAPPALLYQKFPLPSSSPASPTSFMMLPLPPPPTHHPFLPAPPAPPQQQQPQFLLFSPGPAAAAAHMPPPPPSTPRGFFMPPPPPAYRYFQPPPPPPPPPPI